MKWKQVNAFISILLFVVVVVFVHFLIQQMVNRPPHHEYLILVYVTINCFTLAKTLSPLYQVPFSFFMSSTYFTCEQNSSNNSHKRKNKKFRKTALKWITAAYSTVFTFAMFEWKPRIISSDKHIKKKLKQFQPKRNISSNDSFIWKSTKNNTFYSKHM